MDLLYYSIKTFTSIFIILGPFSIVPTFITLTEGNSKEQNHLIIKKTIILSLFLCLFFTFLGRYFFIVFGITIHSFRIAGGLLLLIMSINMLHASRSKIRSTPDEQKEGMDKEDISVFPLAIPMIIGPGAISTVVLLTSEETSFIHWMIIVLSIVASCSLLYLILRLSEIIYTKLGNTGINIVTRIMGLILASIAVEYMIQGIKGFFKL